MRVEGLVSGQVLLEGTALTLVGEGRAEVRLGDRVVAVGSGPGLLEGIPVGGPYRLTLAEGQPVVEPFWVGDLWLLIGQSNMEGVGDLADAPEPHPLVQTLSMARTWRPAREPLHWLAESPDRVHHGGRPQAPDEAASARGRAVKGVGPGLWFARYRAEATGRPQGLIAAAHGGTSLADWARAPEAEADRSLYASALASVRAAGGRLTGVLWYQGCNDTNPRESADYADRLVELMRGLGRDLGQADLPWLVCQIGRVVGRTDDEASWNAVQDAQAGLEARWPRLGLAATVDLELDDWIHLSGRSQAVLGRRLADLAAGGEGPPRPRAARWDPSDPGGPAVRVSFDRVVGGWAPAGLPRGLGLVDPQGRPRPLVCRTRVDGDDLVLRVTTDELVGFTVAYARGTDPVANLVDGAGRALPVFSGLAIDGLPPVTPWFRRWRLRTISAPGAFGALAAPRADDEGGEEVVNDGWWYLVLSGRWAPGRVVSGWSWFDCGEPMDLEARFGNDVPVRLWIDGRLVVSEDESTALTSSNIDFERHRWSATYGPGRHEVAFVARSKADGSGLGLNLRLARLDPGPLPVLWS